MYGVHVKRMLELETAQLLVPDILKMRVCISYPFC